MRRQLAMTLIAVVGVAGCGAPLPPGPTQPSPAPTSTNQGSAAPAPTPDSDPLVGNYALDLTMDELTPGCGGVPESVKHRAYMAAIQSNGEANYTVTLAGGDFLSGSICDFVPSHLGCNQFTASRAGDTLRFDLANNNDDGHGGHIVESAPQAGWFELIGSTAGAVDSRAVSSKGSGTLWYCPSALAYPFPCPSFVSCAVGNLRMTFVRQ